MSGALVAYGAVGVIVFALLGLAALSRWAWLRTERGLRRAREPKVGEWD